MLVRLAPTTVVTKFTDLKRFVGWLVNENEITDNPMRKMCPPIAPEVPVPVVPLEAQQALLATCEGAKSLADLRDAALIRCYLDTGARLSEVANLTVPDTDQDNDIFYVLGRAAAPAPAPVGAKTARALDRYLRAGPAQVTSLASPSFGSADRERCPRRASGRCSVDERRRSGSATSMRTNCATPLPTVGWPRAAMRPTSCA